MPQVPVYQGPQVKDAPLQGGFQQAPDVSSGTRALAQGLGAVGDVALRVAERDAQVEAYTADTNIAGAWLKWSAENSRKYQGENAGQYLPAAEEWWNTTKKNATEALSPRAKALVGESLQRKMASSLGGVAQHVEQQKDQHADQVASASIGTTIQFGATSGDVEGAAKSVRTQVAQLGGRKGWTTAQVQAETEKQLSALHISRVTTLASDNPTAAQAYFEANKEEIAFTQQERIRGVLKAEGDNQFALTTAASLAPLPLAEQLKKAAEIADPARREKTLHQVKSNYALVKEAQAQREKEVSDFAWQLVGKNQKVPEAILSAMDGKERVQLRDYLTRKAEQGDRSVKTNPVALAKVYDLMRDDPDSFKKLRMESLQFQLGGSDIEQVARIQRDMLKSPKHEKDVATAQQQIAAATGAWNAEKKAAFSSAVFDELDAFQRANKGTAANFDERKKIINKLLVDGEVLTGAWYKADANKKYYEASPAERSSFAPFISSADRALLKAQFKAEGNANPTDDEMLTRFKLAKGFK